MKFRHLHFPNLTAYNTASSIQTNLVSRFLAYKKQASLLPPSDPSQTSSAAAAAAADEEPQPTILTFQFPPTYTAGLRSIDRLSLDEITHLRANGAAHFAYASRGGQTTFHGPGQLVAYPIINLKRHRLSARCYVAALEQAVIETCAAYGVRARTTGDVGVWVTREADGVERKICAVGVHLRRFVSSHGIGLNVSTEMKWFERIVACGLEGRETTSLLQEGVEGLNVDDVGRVFVEKIGARLSGVDGVEYEEKDAEELLREIS